MGSFPTNNRGQRMGIAFVTYGSQKGVKAALKLNGSSFENKEISVKMQDDRMPMKTKEKGGGDKKAGGQANDKRGKGHGKGDGGIDSEDIQGKTRNKYLHKTE